MELAHDLVRDPAFIDYLLVRKRKATLWISYLLIAMALAYPPEDTPLLRSGLLYSIFSGYPKTKIFIGLLSLARNLDHDLCYHVKSMVRQIQDSYFFESGSRHKVLGRRRTIDLWSEGIGSVEIITCTGTNLELDSMPFNFIPLGFCSHQFQYDCPEYDSVYE